MPELLLDRADGERRRRRLADLEVFLLLFALLGAGEGDLHLGRLEDFLTGDRCLRAGAGSGDGLFATVAVFFLLALFCAVDSVGLPCVAEADAAFVFLAGGGDSLAVCWLAAAALVLGAALEVATRLTSDLTARISATWRS